MAEVAVVFAGFSALAGVIGDRRRISARHNLVRLQAVVFSSLVILLSAYLPILGFSYGLAAARVWQIASAISLVLNWLALSYMVRRGQRSGLHRSDRWFTRLGYPLEIFVELPLFANLFTLFPERAFAFYLTSLLAVLCQTMVAFVVLIATLLHTESGSDPGPGSASPGRRRPHDGETASAS